MATKQVSPQRAKRIVMELMQQTASLTKKDLADWRAAWQMAINHEYPVRYSLYDIYADTEIDLHLSGCVGQRLGFVKSRSFKLVNQKTGKEDPTATELLNAPWFKTLMDYILESIYWGHSLIELGDVVVVDGKPSYADVVLIPRKHVVPEYGYLTIIAGDDWHNGFNYRDPVIYDRLIEAGTPRGLGLYHKAASQTIPKRHVMAFWDQFSEIFGMPMRIAKTTQRDPAERAKVERALDNMGTAFWALFTEGTEIEIKESSRGDSFNVYDKRIDRANSEMSKLIIGQTMTIEDGSSLSQSETHLKVFNNLVEGDADMLRDVINTRLLPRMIRHGFPVAGLRFEWDYSIDYTPEQQVAYESMLNNSFDVDPKYFEEKYGVKILGKRAPVAPSLRKPASDFFD